MTNDRLFLPCSHTDCGYNKAVVVSHPILLDELAVPVLNLSESRCAIPQLAPIHVAASSCLIQGTGIPKVREYPLGVSTVSVNSCVKHDILAGYDVELSPCHSRSCLQWIGPCIVRASQA